MKKYIIKNDITRLEKSVMYYTLGYKYNQYKLNHSSYSIRFIEHQINYINKTFMKWKIERLTNESYTVSFEYRNEIQHL